MPAKLAKQEHNIDNDGGARLRNLQVFAGSTALQKNAGRSDSELKKGIADFYDESSDLWIKIWGEHMHHGYYEDGVKTDHKQAQIDMIDRVLNWAGADKIQKSKALDVVDVGCGVGGASRHIASMFKNAKATGITLSPYQCNKAKELTATAGLSDRVDFQVADAMSMPFPDNSFDIVWSLESGEHMPDKQKFVSELNRVCKPGGKIILVTWCHRDLGASESSLSYRELRLLDRINRAYYLPDWCSVADYKRIGDGLGLVEIRSDDWTDRIKAFWPAVIQSALRPRGFFGLFRSGFRTLRGALAMFLMVRGYKKGLIKFGLITFTKPKQ